MQVIHNSPRLMIAHIGDEPAKSAASDSPPPATHWKMEVHTDGAWTSNNCTYATEAEAIAAGKELLSRWWVPDDSRAVPSDSPVNYFFNFDTGRPEMLSTPAPVEAAPPVADHTDEWPEDEAHLAVTRWRELAEDIDDLEELAECRKSDIDHMETVFDNGEDFARFLAEIAKIEAPHSDASDLQAPPVSGFNAADVLALFSA